ncbi:TPA: hypothetical protein ACM7CJ_004978, partial [Escherichia coli]
LKTTHWTLTTAEHRRLRAAFLQPAITPSHAHHRTKHPADTPTPNGQTKRRHDALRRWKIKSAPPPARSAFPASPARFMGRF